METAAPVMKLDASLARKTADRLDYLSMAPHFYPSDGSFERRQSRPAGLSIVTLKAVTPHA